MGSDGLHLLDAVELRDRLARGAVSAVAVAESVLAQIAEREPEVQAWAWLDGDFVLRQAKALDALRQTGRPIGPLHGVPVALKDIIDTRDIPTENGTALDKGRVPKEDAVLVRRLKAAGAVILGKTVTTELAYFAPGKTRNPVNAEHTPGGSSQGSAAAVSAGMAPLAVGTQTAGSVIRPASFCGVFGYKPTFGRIARTGVLAQAPSLDTIGVFARSVAGLALLAEAIWGDDPGDPATSPMPTPRLVETALAPPPVRPAFAMLQMPIESEPEMAEAMAELASFLDEDSFPAPLPGSFREALEVHERIQLAELSKSFHHYERRDDGHLSQPMLEALARGKAIPARDYIAALDWREMVAAGLEEILTRCDALLAPAAPGPAPKGLAATGSPAFNRLATLAGLPAVTIPAFTASNGMPMGLQLIGRRGDDARLLRTANWLANLLGEAE